MKSKLHFVDICAKQLAFGSLLNEETKVHTPVASIKTARFVSSGEKSKPNHERWEKLFESLRKQFEEFWAKSLQSVMINGGLGWNNKIFS